MASQSPPFFLHRVSAYTKSPRRLCLGASPPSIHSSDTSSSPHLRFLSDDFNFPTTTRWRSSSPAELTHSTVSSKAMKTLQSSVRTAGTGAAKYTRDGQSIVIDRYEYHVTVLTTLLHRQWFTFCFVVRLPVQPLNPLHLSVVYHPPTTRDKRRHQ